VRVIHLPTCLLLALSALFVTGCAQHEQLRGVNLLQSARVSLGSELTNHSLHRVKALGANAVAFIPFFRQESIVATEVTGLAASDFAALQRAIRWARWSGLRVIVKPQILVADSWAGEVAPENWQQWFDSYGGELMRIAALCQGEGVEILVIGTELNHSVTQPYWHELIRQVRAEFKGQLSYAAHGVVGLQKVTFWDELDSAAVTLYPSLGENADDSWRQINDTVSELYMAAMHLPVPVWVAEVGIASRTQARRRPWAWYGLSTEEQGVDLDVQREVIAQWLSALAVDWIEGVMLWSWSSDPQAGGTQDNGYNIQNKPAERQVMCHWRGRCE